MTHEDPLESAFFSLDYIWILKEGHVSSRYLYQFKSKLYLDFASFANCVQSNFDVNPKNSNDSKSKENDFLEFYSLKFFNHFSLLDYVYVVVAVVVVVFYFSFY